MANKHGPQSILTFGFQTSGNFIARIAISYSNLAFIAAFLLLLAFIALLEKWGWTLTAMDRNAARSMLLSVDFSTSWLHSASLYLGTGCGPTTAVNKSMSPSQGNFYSALLLFCNMKMKASKYQGFLAGSSILFFFPFLGSTSSWATLARAENPNNLAPCTVSHHHAHVGQRL